MCKSCHFPSACVHHRGHSGQGGGGGAIRPLSKGMRGLPRVGTPSGQHAVVHCTHFKKKKKKKKGWTSDPSGRPKSDGVHATGTKPLNRVFRQKNGGAHPDKP